MTLKGRLSANQHKARQSVRYSIHRGNPQENCFIFIYFYNI